MSTSPSPHEAQRTSISLAKLAAILAATFCIAFGLCTVSVTMVMGVYQKIGTGFIWASVITEIICLIGLLVIGIIAIFRSFRGRENYK